MQLDSLVQEGWVYHDRESQRLAEELESVDFSAVTQQNLGPFLQLSNHTIGEHLGDWKRALNLAEKAISQVNESQISEQGFTQLAVVYYMNQQISKSHSAEIKSLQRSQDAMSTYINVKALLASALAGSGSIGEALDLVTTINQFGRGIDIDGAFNRSLAITNNNVASDLLGLSKLPNRSTTLMMDCAFAALFFWKRCGTWENEERALYLLALVHNRTKKFKQALEFTQQALEVIHSNGKDEIDQAFIRLAAARAHIGLDDLERYEIELLKADNLAKSSMDASLLAMYENQKSEFAQTA